MVSSVNKVVIWDYDTNGPKDLASSNASTRKPGVSRSGSITTGGTAQTLAPANSARTGLQGVNKSSGILYLNEVGGTASSTDPDSYPIQPGGGFTIQTNQTVSVWGATTGQSWTATET